MMEQKQIVLILPTPPSVNAAYRNVPGRGRAITQVYRDWKDEADFMFMQQKNKIRPIPGTRELLIQVPRETKGDISNRIKAAEDYLVQRGITGDDKHNDKVTIERADVDICTVTVTAVEGT